ncbi:2431_t:CDS:2, partial [Scutellospora calospora]
NPTLEDREMFCEIHYMETTIVPDGIQKGYPTEINFALLNSRIIQMKDELLNIINRKTKSYYYDFALRVCNEIGQRKASNPMTIMGRYNTFKPGYYSSRGLDIISSVLSDLFLYTNVLTSDLAYPKSQIDYLLEVLVPETALRLISQDRGNIELEDARKIMEDSSSFEVKNIAYSYSDLPNIKNLKLLKD